MSGTQPLLCREDSGAGWRWVGMGSMPFHARAGIQIGQQDGVGEVGWVKGHPAEGGCAVPGTRPRWHYYPDTVVSECEMASLVTVQGPPSGRKDT